MFTHDQIEFMKKIGLKMDFTNLSEADYVEIEDKVGDVYTEAVEDSPNKETSKIRMCESILDQLG